MPNRIIKESVWDSPSIEKLSVLAERHFYRLLPLPDDFGCFQATSSVVKGRLYPLKPKVTEKQITTWHKELEGVGICKFWRDNGRVYGIFVNWGKHQRIRSLHQRKTPEPPKVIKLLDWSDDNCRQVPSSDRLNPIPILNPIPNPKKTSCSRNSKPEFL